MINKIKQIIRIIYPKKVSKVTLFEYQLKRNVLIKSFHKKDEGYLLSLKNNFEIYIRDFNYSDYDVFYQIFNCKEYGVFVKLFSLNPNFNKEKIIIDAGANIGLTSLYFLSFFNDCKIFGIEPSIENCKIYSRNTQKFGNIKIYQNALSEKSNSFYNLDRGFRDGKDWSISTKESSNGSIKGISIKDIVSENNLDYISFLKIDIEGAERFIFKIGNDFDYLKLTQIIAIEIHDEFDCRNSINEILIENNFFIFETGELTIGINKNLI
jgi:FkbM family methyltransferase